MLRTLLVLLLAAVTLALWTVLRPDGGDGSQQVGVEQTRSQLFFRLDGSGPLRFKLEPGTRRVKLVSFLALPEGTGFDPEQVFQYGLRATLKDSFGAQIWSQDLWFETSRRGAVPPGGSQEDEPVERSWLAEGDTVLSDSRLLEMDVAAPEELPSSLVLEPLEDNAQPVLLRAYRRDRGLSEAAPLTIRGLDSDDRERLASRVGSTPWSELDYAEREVLASLSWQRMQPVGARDRDYWTERLILSDRVSITGSRLLPGSHLLEPGRAIVVNLRGPSAVTLSCRPAATREQGAKSPRGLIRLIELTQFGALRSMALPPPPHSSWPLLLQLPGDEVRSLSVLNDSDLPIKVDLRVEARPELLFARTRFTRERDGLHARLGPDITVSSWVRLLRGGEDVRYDLRRSAGGRLRLQLRVPGGEAARVTARIEDEDGELLGEVELEVPAGLSPYETLRSNSPLEAAQPAGLPLQREFWVPAGAHVLQLQADRPVDARLFAPAGLRWQRRRVDPDYELETRGTELRFEPLLTHRWIPLRPLDRRRLMGEHQWASLHSQVRLEPAEGTLRRFAEARGGEEARLPLGRPPRGAAERGDGAADRQVDGSTTPTKPSQDDALPPLSLMGWEGQPSRQPGVAWIPEGEVPRQRLLERWSPEPDRPDEQGWPPGARARLRVGEAQRVQLGAPGDTEAFLWLEIWLPAGAELDGELSVFLDDRRFATLPLDAAAVSSELGPMPAGEHELRVEGPRAARVLSSAYPLSPEARGELYRARTVFRFEADTPLLVRLPPSAQGEAALYVFPYFELPKGAAAEAARTEVVAKLAGGVQRDEWRPFERTSPREIRGDLRGLPGDPGFLAGRAERRIVEADPLVVRAGDDLLGEPLRIELRRLGQGAPIWLRLVAIGVPPQTRERGSFWTRELARTGSTTRWADPFAEGPPLDRLLSERWAAPEGPFHRAPRNNLPLARELGRQLLWAARGGGDAAVPALSDQARQLGFELLALKAEGRRYLLLQEAEAEGRGLLLLRFGGEDSELVLQAPHVFHDKKTGPIAIGLLKRSAARALQANTCHRDRRDEDEAGAGGAADLAHRRDSWFHALMLGLLDGMRSPVVVQLHGFGRSTVSDPSIDLIVAGGLRRHQAALLRFLDSARRGLPRAGIRSSPEETPLLGARRNAQGRALAARPGAAFVHIELGPELRERLLDDPDVEEALSQAIVVAATAPP